MPRVGFEPTIPALEVARTIHALDSAATKISKFYFTIGKFKLSILSRVLVTVDGVRMVIGFTDHSQFVATTKYNTLSDCHARNHSTLNHLSVLSLVFTLCFLATDLSQFHCNFKCRCNYSKCKVLHHTLSLLGTV
jgi:hypothetical protein